MGGFVLATNTSPPAHIHPTLTATANNDTCGQRSIQPGPWRQSARSQYPAPAAIASKTAAGKTSE